MRKPSVKRGRVCHVLMTMFTGADNSSVDMGRVVWAAGVFALIGFEATAVARGAAFDAMNFAGALSALAVGHGASLKLKGDTEPAPETK